MPPQFRTLQHPTVQAAVDAFKEAINVQYGPLHYSKIVATKPSNDQISFHLDVVPREEQYSTNKRLRGVNVCGFCGHYKDPPHNQPYHYREYHVVQFLKNFTGNTELAGGATVPSVLTLQVDWAIHITKGKKSIISSTYLTISILIPRTIAILIT